MYLIYNYHNIFLYIKEHLHTIDDYFETEIWSLKFEFKMVGTNHNSACAMLVYSYYRIEIQSFWWY